MTRRTRMLTAFGFSMMVAACSMGCGGGSPTEPEVSAKETKETTPVTPAVERDNRAPGEVVRIFLEGLKTGNEDQIESMLTDLARTNNLFNPQPRNNATYKIGDVRPVSDKIVHVPTVWTTKDEDGKVDTDDAIWALRLEPQGWRIAGTLMPVKLLNKMVALDFENKAEYEAIKKQIETEIEEYLAKQEAGGQKDVEVAVRPKTSDVKPNPTEFENRKVEPGHDPGADDSPLRPRRIE